MVATIVNARSNWQTSRGDNISMGNQGQEKLSYKFINNYFRIIFFGKIIYIQIGYNET